MCRCFLDAALLGVRPEKLCSQIIHAPSLFLDSQIIHTRLIFVAPRDDSPCHPCSTEGANRWRLLAERGAAPEGSASSAGPPGASGDTARPNYMGPSGNGLVERMNAGESPRNQGRSEWAPLSVSRRRSRGLRKTPQWSAERRAGPRYGSAIPSADGRGHAVRLANGCGVPRPRISALRFPLIGSAKGSKPTIWHDSPPGCAARQRSRTAIKQIHGEE